MTSILMVLTGARHWTLRDGTEHPTGFWAEEFVAPHQVLTGAGVEVVVATPGGVRPLADELSLTPEMNGGSMAAVAELRRYLAESDGVLSAPLRIEDLDAADYDAIFVPGGHGPMQDLATSLAIGSLLTTFLDDASKMVVSVCHGPASFLTAQRDDGRWAFDGRRLSAFTNEEETQVGFAANAPWLLEDRLRAAGARFEAGPAWGSHVVVDGNLITGQNPGSARDAATTLLAALGVRT